MKGQTNIRSNLKTLLLHSGPADGVVFDEIFELRFLGVCQSCKLYSLSFYFPVGIQDFAHRKIWNLLKGYAIKFQVLVGHNFKFIWLFSDEKTGIFIVESQSSHTDIVNLVHSDRVFHDDENTVPRVEAWPLTESKREKSFKKAKKHRVTG